MLYAISIQQVDPARQDVYLASVADQEAAIGESADFRGRTVLRSQTDVGRYWTIDAWTDRQAMELALAAARTLASVAALQEEPVQVLTTGEELARASPSVQGDAEDGFFLVAENWVKEVCVEEYLETLARLGRELSAEGGFHRRLLLRDVERSLRFFVVDWWESERAAYQCYERRRTSEVEATRFLALLAERGKPLIASGLKVNL